MSATFNIPTDKPTVRDWRELLNSLPPQYDRHLVIKGAVVDGEEEDFPATGLAIRTADGSCPPAALRII